MSTAHALRTRRRERSRSSVPADLEESLDRTGLTAEDHRVLEECGLAVGDPVGRAGGGGPRALRAVDGQGRDVVLRVLDLPEHDRGRLLQRLSELRRLRHPGLGRIREVIVLPGERAAVTMDLVDGADLAVVLGARGHLTRSEAARLLDDVGSALAVLHAAGLSHGDVSASNIVVTTDGGAVLIDLAGSVMEQGTQEWAAPERLAGGAATPASDVYSLAALLLGCARGTAVLHELVESVLGDALAEDPRKRPAARAVVARCHEIAAPGSIELPDGARLAAGALRAAACVPTRRVGRRSRLPGRGRIRSGDRGRRGARLLVAAVGLGLVAAIGLAAWSTSGGSFDLVPSWWRGERDGDGPSAAASTAVPAGEQELAAVVTGLCAARDRALEAGDEAALASTTEPGSPAALADAALVAELAEQGESVVELETWVSGVERVDVPERAAVQWPGAVAARLSRSQQPSVRERADGTRRTVPAQAAQEVVLVLLPDPWRVVEVLPVE